MLRDGYTIAVEQGHENYDELLPLYRQHYEEMQKRLADAGVPIAGFNMQVDRYFAAWKAGYLVNFVLRFHGKAVGCSNVYVMPDMHNGELVAREDTIYVLPEHRNGCGRELTKYILQGLRNVGVKRATMTSATDLRSGVLWKRMGFKHVADCLTYTF